MKQLYEQVQKEPTQSIFEHFNIQYQPENENNDQFWQIIEPKNKPDISELIYQGRLYQKNPENESEWQSFCFELYPEILVKSKDTPQQNNSNYKSSSLYQNQNEREENNQVCYYIPLYCCFVKKIKYSENSQSKYKYGLRLQRKNQKTEIFSDTQDIFTKYYQEMKKFSILPKFNKKYKILTKIQQVKEQKQHHQFLYYCYKFSEQMQYQVKIIDKDLINDHQTKQNLLNEIQILRKLENSQIQNLQEVYEDEQHVFVVQDFVPGINIQQLISNDTYYSLFLEEVVLSDMLYKLLHALAHLEQKHIFHRNICPYNIIVYLQENNKQQQSLSINLPDVTLTNFSNAGFYSQKHEDYTVNKFKKCGTPGYIAPEIFSNKEYDNKVDIFSLGATFYYFIFGKPPFDGNNYEEIMKKNERCNLNIKNMEQPYLSKSGLDLLDKMLQKDPQKRPPASKLLNYPWFINMKSRNEHQKLQNKLNKLPSLSTIMENSDANILDFSMNQSISGPISIQQNLKKSGFQKKGLSVSNMGNNISISNIDQEQILDNEALDNSTTSNCDFSQNFINNDEQNIVDEFINDDQNNYFDLNDKKKVLNIKIDTQQLTQSISSQDYPKEYESNQQSLSIKMKNLNSNYSIQGPGQLSKQIRKANINNLQY